MQSIRSQLEPFVPRLTSAIAEISTAHAHENFCVKFLMDFAATNLPGHAFELGKQEDPQDQNDSFSSNFKQLCQEINALINHCESINQEQISEIEAQQD